MPDLSPATIAEGLRRILEPGQVTELRVLGYRKPGSTYAQTVSGYFEYERIDQLALEAAKLSPRADGVYFVPNLVNTDLLARCSNKAKPMGKGDVTTADRDIIRRRWLLIDCDPIRPSGISANDSEKAAAFSRAKAIVAYLTSQGWPEPIGADSGNGAHLAYSIDEPTEDDGLVKGCLAALAQRFDDEAVHVDTTVCNAARIWKLYGTWARKGDNVQDRPHRVAKLLHVPDSIAIVTTEQLRALAAEVETPESETPAKPSPPRSGPFDLDQWMADHLPDAQKKVSADGDLWVLPVCPFNPEHNRGEAFVIRRRDGTIGAGCKHASCQGWGWKELRQKLDPREKRKRAESRNTEWRRDVLGIGGFPLTDLGNAERLVKAHGENIRYDVDRGSWLYWNGCRWQPDATGQIERLAAGVIGNMCSLIRDVDLGQAKELVTHIKRSESAPRLRAMIDLARFLRGIPVRSADLDLDPWSLNVQNGTIDLRSGQLRPHRREDLITKLAPVKYNAEASCRRWQQFLAEVFSNDQDIVGFVRRMIGYLLTGDTREEAIFLFVGKGRNGKSKFAETLRAVTGDYAADTPFSTFIERRDSNTADLAALLGKRIVTAAEGSEAEVFNDGLLKQLSGGDPITCRFLYQQYFSYVPSYKVLFCTNEVPYIRSLNAAMHERLKVVPFRTRFYDPGDGKEPVRDDQLLPKLLAEKPGILAWAVQGCLEWQRSGLRTPQVIRNEVDRLFQAQDVLAEFIEARCLLTTDAWVTTHELWQEYLSWCEESGSKPGKMKIQGFSRKLTARDGIDSGHRGNRRVLTGIGIAAAQDEAGGAETCEDGCGLFDQPANHYDITTLTPVAEKCPDQFLHEETFAQRVESRNVVMPGSQPDTLPNPPEPTPEPKDLTHPYTCSGCRGEVFLQVSKPRPIVYGYTCPNCQHSGLVPEIEYDAWLTRSQSTTPAAPAERTDKC